MLFIYHIFLFLAKHHAVVLFLKVNATTKFLNMSVSEYF